MDVDISDTFSDDGEVITMAESLMQSVLLCHRGVLGGRLSRSGRVNRGYVSGTEGSSSSGGSSSGSDGGGGSTSSSGDG